MGCSVSFSLGLYPSEYVNVRCRYESLSDSDVMRGSVSAVVVPQIRCEYVCVGKTKTHTSL